MRIVCASAGFTRRKTPGGKTFAIPDGSPHYRLILPALRAADSLGWEILITDTVEVDKRSGAISGQNLTTGQTQDADIVIFQRWMGQDGDKVILRARAGGQVVLQDIDDDFERIRPQNNAHKQAKPQNNVNHFTKIIAASDGVIASTPELAKRMSRHNQNVALYRNAVEPALFAPKPEPEPINVGWAGHLGYRSGDLEHVRPGIERLFAERPALRFFHVGTSLADTDTAAERLGLDPARQDSCLGAPIGEYPELLGNIGVGIVPLTPVAFNKSKSWLKGLEYAASGIPFVASALPEYLSLAKEGAGVCARSPLEWRNKLAMLLDDQAFRDEMRASGLRAAERLGVANQWQQWAMAIRALSQHRINVPLAPVT